MGMFAVVKGKCLVWTAVVAVLLVVAVTCACTLPALAATKRLPVYCVEDEGRIAITFDAAWGADKTKDIVDVLCDHGVRATFFLTGFWIEAYPQETLYVWQHGMQIGNHSANHRNMGKMTAAACYDEINAVNEQLFDLLGQRAQVFRAPFGDYGDTLLSVLDGMGMRCIQWDVDSLDWKGLSATQLVERVVGRCQGGSIILCHNNSDHILEALPTIITQLQGKGYTFCTVDKLLEGKQGSIDHSGRLLAA